MMRRTAAIASIMVLGILALAGSAGAEEITNFEAFPSTTQAGGHPDITILQSVSAAPGTARVDRTEDVRRFIVSMPTGVIGNPHVVPRCSLDDFSLGQCSPDSQVGVAGAGLFGLPPGNFGAPIYNLEPRPDQAGLLGFKVNLGGVVQYIEISGRTESDYGLDSVNTPIFHPISLPSVLVQLWGVPADPSHDPVRFKPPVTNDCNVYPTPSCSDSVTGASSNLAPEPFLSNPTACGSELHATLEAEFYSRVIEKADSPWPATTGCDQLAFNPSLTVKPTAAEGDSASGLDVDLKVPQIASPYTPSPSQIRGVWVTLPEGFSINPNAANGKLACSDEQTAIGTRRAASCPEFSKVGTLTIDSSALPGPVPGGVYLGEPKPGDPYRLILAANGFGTNIKLAGSARANPETGQIKVAFENLPQSPLTRFEMHFFGSERGLLATPTQCGTYPVEARFEPWNSVLPDQTSTSFFGVSFGPGGSPCPDGPRRLQPRFTAGSVNPTAGRQTPYKVDLVRDDGEQNLTGLTVSPPPGFSGVLRGVEYCPESALSVLASGTRSGVLEAAEPSCPLQSQIGTAVAGAGAGSQPLYVPGRVYLAGPYKGAPLSLVVVIPAVSGPYDLGNVAVRAAIRIDPVTARVTAESDPLPQILGGIPLRTRSIRVELDRPGFAVNPTSCRPLATDAVVLGSEGGVATLSSHYQVGNCAILPFEPTLAFRMRGGMGRAGHPTLTAQLTAPEGSANLARTVVKLPKSQILDNANIQAPCTRAQWAAESCPASSVVGQATAVSPLLAEPLRGSVYLKVSDNKLPDLVADLHGQIDVEVSARIDSVKGRIRTSFTSIPDVPVTSFTLTMSGGKRGLLFNNQNLCRRPQVANVLMRGQNGATESGPLRVRTACAKRRKGGRKASTVRLFRARKAARP